MVGSRRNYAIGKLDHAACVAEVRIIGRLVLRVSF